MTAISFGWTPAANRALRWCSTRSASPGEGEDGSGGWEEVVRKRGERKRLEVAVGKEVDWREELHDYVESLGLCLCLY